MIQGLCSEAETRLELKNSIFASNPWSFANPTPARFWQFGCRAQARPSKICRKFAAASAVTKFTKAYPRFDFGFFFEIGIWTKLHWLPVLNISLANISCVYLFGMLLIMIVVHSFSSTELSETNWFNCRHGAYLALRASLSASRSSKRISLGDKRENVASDAES